MNEHENSPTLSKDELREGIDYVVSNGLRLDAKEFDPKYKDIIKKVEEEASESVVHVDLFWFDIWRKQKKMLKERYGIEWRSLAELNPDMSFD